MLEVLRIVEDTFDRVHIVLQFGDLTNQEPEGLLNADYVTERDAGLGRGDGEPGGDSEDGDDESEKKAEQIHSHTQPTLIRDRQPVSPGMQESASFTRAVEETDKPILDVHPILALPSEPFGFTVRPDGSQTCE